MMENRSSCLQYLRDFFTATKGFYHPSNVDDFQEDLIKFLAELTDTFVYRVYL